MQTAHYNITRCVLKLPLHRIEKAIEKAKLYFHLGCVSNLENLKT